MLEVSETEASGTADDEVEHRPAKAEAAGLTGEAADDLGPPLDLAQRALEQVSAAQPFSQSQRVIQMHAQRRQVFSETCRRTGVVVFELTDQCTKSSLAVGGRPRLVQRGPVSLADAVDDLRLLRQLGEHIAQPVHGA